MTKETTKNSVKQIAKMSFEDALARLENIVEALSSQKINLDDMIKLHEEGAILKDHCTKKLQEAQLKIETVGQE